MSHELGAISGSVKNVVDLAEEFRLEEFSFLANLATLKLLETSVLREEYFILTADNLSFQSLVLGTLLNSEEHLVRFAGTILLELLTDLLLELHILGDALILGVGLVVLVLRLDTLATLPDQTAFISVDSLPLKTVFVDSSLDTVLAGRSDGESNTVSLLFLSLTDEFLNFFSSLGSDFLDQILVFVDLGLSSLQLLLHLDGLQNFFLNEIPHHIDLLLVLLLLEFSVDSFNLFLELLDLLVNDLSLEGVDNNFFLGENTLLIQVNFVIGINTFLLFLNKFFKFFLNRGEFTFILIFKKFFLSFLMDEFFVLIGLSLRCGSEFLIFLVDNFVLDEFRELSNETCELLIKFGNKFILLVESGGFVIAFSLKSDQMGILIRGGHRRYELLGDRDHFSFDIKTKFRINVLNLLDSNDQRSHGNFSSL